MGEIRINLSNFITIGLISFIFIWVANKGLDYAGLAAYKA